MRLNITLILSIIIAVGLVAFGFTYYQISSERTKLKSELEIRASQVAEEIFQSKPFALDQLNPNNIEHFVDSINNKYNLSGIVVYFNNDSILNNSTSAPLIDYSRDHIEQAIVADTSNGNFITSDGNKIYQYIKPIKMVILLMVLLFFILTLITSTTSLGTSGCETF